MRVNLNTKIVAALLIGLALFFRGAKTLKRYFLKAKNSAQVLPCCDEKQVSRNSIFLNGQIVIKNLYKGYASATGVIKQIHLSEGQKVTVGGPVLEMQDNNSSAFGLEISESEYQGAKNNFIWISKKYERAKELFAEGLISLEQYEGDQYDFQKSSIALNQCKIRVDRAQTHVNNLIIKSPVCGTISAVKVAVGERAGEGALLFEVMPDCSSWQGVFTAQEFDLKNLEVGKKVSLSIPSLGACCDGTISFVSRVGKQRSTFAGFDVLVDLIPDACNKPLSSGLSAQVEVDV